jgi:hypothetical protein
VLMMRERFMPILLIRVGPGGRRRRGGSAGAVKDERFAGKQVGFTAS